MCEPRRGLVAAAALCLAAGGCIPSLQGNDARDASHQVPARFGLAPGAAAEGLAAQTTNVAQQTWGAFFSSPEVRALIEVALSRNQELNLRLQEIVIAQSEVGARRGEVLPRLGAAVGAGAERAGRYTSRGQSDAATGLPENLGDLSFGLVGSWEVDLWRRLRDARDAADLRYLGSIEAKNFVSTQIIAEVARSYYDLIAVDSQIGILLRNIELQQDALEVVRLEMQGARVTALAVQRFEAEVLKNRSRQYELEQERVQTENRINFLLGRYPQPVGRDVREFDVPLPPLFAAGLPAELLGNRPDVKQAEVLLAAAKLDVKVARAAFFPALSLDAGVGYRAFNLTHLVTTPASLVFNVAGNLVAPLLNRQAITAQYRAANARQLQAVFGYERTVLQAYTEVVNQLAKVDNLRRTYELKAQQVETLARSVAFSRTLFQSARADYMEVLLTRRDSLEAEMELVETKKQQFQTMVSIYQALGGGWRAAQAAAPAGPS